MAARIARALGLPDDLVTLINRAAPLHDVGKIGVSDQVLKKPGKLTTEEYDEMKRHPEIGGVIMERSSFLRPGLPAVLHHQERWDGSGYPRGLRGEEISLQGRIVAVVDTYDAIISSRPYRDASSCEFAMEEIRRSSGTQFDPVVVEAFFRAEKKNFPDDPDTPSLPAIE